MARPRIEIDKKIFEGMLKIQCTCDEIADVFGCCHDTVERWCKREYKESFSVVNKRFQGQGKTSLRRWMFKAAEKGNVSMLIWLSKQHLGMRDQPIDESKEEVYRTLPSMVDPDAENKD